MRAIILAAAILSGAAILQHAHAESRDLEARALKGMCLSTRPGKSEQDRLGCAAFLDGFVRGLTRGRRCPATDYEPVMKALLAESLERLSTRRADEVIEELVGRVHPCGA